MTQLLSPSACHVLPPQQSHQSQCLGNAVLPPTRRQDLLVTARGKRSCSALLEDLPRSTGFNYISLTVPGIRDTAAGGGFKHIFELKLEDPQSSLRGERHAGGIYAKTNPPSGWSYFLFRGGTNTNAKSCRVRCGVVGGEGLMGRWTVWKEATRPGAPAKRTTTGIWAEEPVRVLQGATGLWCSS